MDKKKKNLVFSFTRLLLNDFISNRKIAHKMSIKNRPSSNLMEKLNLKTEFCVEYLFSFWWLHAEPKFWDWISLQICKMLYPMQNIEIRPLAFYTQTAWHLVCSPQGNNCQILIIVMLTPEFPHVQFNLNRYFAGGNKNHNNKEMPYHILCCQNWQNILNHTSNAKSNRTFNITYIVSSIVTQFYQN